MELKPIVTDTYDFPTLIRNGNVYVDKTAYLHRLVSKVDGTMFFALPYAADRRKVVCIGLNYNAKTASFDAPLIAEATNGKGNEWISAHPGCKRMELIKAIGKSARTVDRALAELAANKLVEFRRAPKTGGCHAL